MGPGFLPYMLTLKNSLKTQALRRQASGFHRDKLTVSLAGWISLPSVYQMHTESPHSVLQQKVEGEEILNSMRFDCQ